MPGSSAGGSKAGSASGQLPSDADHLLTKETVQRILYATKSLPPVKRANCLVDGHDGEQYHPHMRFVEEDRIVNKEAMPVVATDKDAYFEQDLKPHLNDTTNRYEWDGHLRVVPTRQALLTAHQATNGSGCPLSKVRPAQYLGTAENRDTAAIELYRKLTGDALTPSSMLIAEKFIIAKRRMAAGELPSPALKRWLDERPGCVASNAERKSKPGKWAPTEKDGNYKSPYPPESKPAPGSLAAGAAPSGKKSGAFASKTISAGVPNLAATPWAGHGGVLDVKDEKRNRTPPPNRYDTTILNMTSNTSWNNQSCRRLDDPMAEGCTWEKCKREPIAPTRKAKGYWLLGGNGLHPSPTFMSSTPRESGVFRTSEMKGPLKPLHGCTLSDPRRRPARGSLEEVAFDVWAKSEARRCAPGNELQVARAKQFDYICKLKAEIRANDGRRPERVVELRERFEVELEGLADLKAQEANQITNVMAEIGHDKKNGQRASPAIREKETELRRLQVLQAEQTFVEERMERQQDGSIVVHPPTVNSPERAMRQQSRANLRFGLIQPRPSSAPPLARQKDGVWNFIPPEKMPARDPPLLETCDPFMVRDAFKAVWGFRPIDLFRDMLESGETQLTVEHFWNGITIPANGRKAYLPNATFADVTKTFRWFDADAGGSLDIAELDHALRSGPLKGERADALRTQDAKRAGARLASNLSHLGKTAKDILSVLDVNGDGIITRGELHERLGELNIYGPPEAVDNLFDYLDPDRSDGIDLSELMSVLKNSSGKLTKQERKALLSGPLGSLPRALAHHLKRRSMDFDGLFKVLDADDSGSVTRQELHDALGKLGVCGSKYEVDVLFDYLDPDHSESITPVEFADAMKEVIQVEKYKPKIKGGDVEFDKARTEQRAKDAARREKQLELKQRARPASPRGEPPPSLPPSAPQSGTSTACQTPRGRAASPLPAAVEWRPVIASAEGLPRETPPSSMEVPPVSSPLDISEATYGFSAPSSPDAGGDDELAATLWPIFASLKLEESFGAAMGWCRENGADNLAELCGAGIESIDELLSTLELKKLKALNLRKRLLEVAERVCSRREIVQQI